MVPFYMAQMGYAKVALVVDMDSSTIPTSFST